MEDDGAPEIVAVSRGGTITVVKNRAFPFALHNGFAARVCTERQFENFALAIRDIPSDRSVKFLLTALERETVLPIAFLSSDRFALHWEFLATTFPDFVPQVTPEAFDGFTLRREGRIYFAGVIRRLRVHGRLVYGFDVRTDSTAPDELLTLEEVARIHTRLTQAFRPRPLGYLPESDGAREAAAGWENPGFPVYLPSQETRFRRGDVDSDGSLGLLDALTLLNRLFAGGRELPCEKSADFDDRGDLGLLDGIGLLNYVFAGGVPPAPPASVCGVDPTDDSLTCESFPGCVCNCP